MVHHVFQQRVLLPGQMSDGLEPSVCGPPTLDLNISTHVVTPCGLGLAAVVIALSSASAMASLTKGNARRGETSRKRYRRKVARMIGSNEGMRWFQRKERKEG